jgi:uncharacterized protein YkvS
MAKQTLTAVVEAVNERGVKVQGQWHNFSSYAQNGAIDHTAQVGDTVELELTNTGWVRKLEVKARAATQQNGQGAPHTPGASGARQLDANQYARMRAVEIAAPIAVNYSEDLEAYMANLAALANWIFGYIQEGDPLG